MHTLSNADQSCNVFGSFIYAETTLDANATAIDETNDGDILEDLVLDELFSIIARTSKTQSLLRIDGFYNQYITYFSSFSMYLGSNNSVMIDVGINPNNTYQFSKKKYSIINS
jgi:hypothetical protein